jgi:phosphatidylinositol alpha-1,6-mannosyltransferase
MERLNWHIAKELDREFDVEICGPIGCSHYVSKPANVTEIPIRPLWRFLIQSGWYALIKSISFRPDLVLAGSGLTAPAALLIARAIGVPAMAYLHGLDIIADHPVYRWLWTPAFRKLTGVIVNSRHSAALANGVKIDSLCVHLLHPGVSIPDLTTVSAESFRSEFKIGQSSILISVGRLTARKGLVEFIERALPALVAVRPEVMLVVIGGEAVDALKKGDGQRDRLLKAASQAGVGDHLILLGEQSDETVANALAASSALIFPVLELPGDVEGFGMVAVEAAAHGVPTVAFDVGGIADAISNHMSGRLLAAGDYTGMVRALLEYIEYPVGHIDREQCRIFARQFDWDIFGEKLRAICRDQIDQQFPR